MTMLLVNRLLLVRKLPLMAALLLVSRLWLVAKLLAAATGTEASAFHVGTSDRAAACDKTTCCCL